MAWIYVIAALVFALGAQVVLQRYRDRRRAPFAVRIKGTGRFTFEIVGESSYQPTLEHLAGGRTEESADAEGAAILVLEDNNPYDNEAVAVESEGMVVGYLSRPNARKYRSVIAELGHPKARVSCGALIVGGWDRGNDRGSFGVKLDLALNRSRFAID